MYHLSRDLRYSHYAGYELGPGNTDELVQAETLIARFTKVNGKGIIKLLIVDRGYVSGEFITRCKEELGIDVLFPLKTNMSAYEEAISLSKMEDAVWECISDTDELLKREQGEEFALISGCIIEDIDAWDSCKCPIYVTVIKTEAGDKWETQKTSYFMLYKKTYQSF